MKKAAISLGLAMLWAKSASAADADLLDRLAALEATQVNLNFVWTMTAACLVFLMQVGFLLLEAGLVRSKNSINVAQKNLVDFVVACVVFGLAGYMLMFGSSIGGWVGFDPSMLAFEHSNDWDFAFFIFQVVFCGTASTIVSGAVAERMKFTAYLWATFFVSAVIYPVFGHWAWGAALETDNKPFLSSMGFIDFAGSSVVHSVGGWVSLAGVLIMGARLGRYDANGKPVKIVGHSPVLATTGALVLWVGWVGFNGGSTVAGTPQFAHIIFNTIVAGAFGSVVAMFVGYWHDKYWRVDRAINGLLGGLVGITAGCDAVGTLGAVLIGTSSGLLTLYVGDLLEEKLKIDDAVGAIPVHGVCGAWGTLMVAVFAREEALLAGDRLSQFGVQALGVAVCFVWAFGLSYIFFTIINRWGGGLRVSTAHELAGLNEAEHGTTLGTGSLLQRMMALSHGGADLAVRLDEGSGDEAAELAYAYNRLMDNIESMVEGISQSAFDLAEAAHDLVGIAETVDGKARGTAIDAASAARTTEDVRQSMDSLVQAVGGVNARAGSIGGAATLMAGHIDAAVQDTQIIVGGIGRIETSVQDATKVVGSAVQQADLARQSVDGLGRAVCSISDVLDLIRKVAEQTNLLALNATIEAARAGDAGKGFAVVANEVKVLANQTSKAVDDISNRVSTIQAEASCAVGVIGRIADVTGSLDQSVATISVAIDEQGRAARNIADSISRARSEVHSVVQALTDVGQMVDDASSRAAIAALGSQQVGDSVGMVSNAAAETNQQAGRLSENADRIARIAQSLQHLVQAFTAPATHIPKALLPQPH